MEDDSGDGDIGIDLKPQKWDGEFLLHVAILCVRKVEVGLLSVLLLFRYRVASLSSCYHRVTCICDYLNARTGEIKARFEPRGAGKRIHDGSCEMTSCCQGSLGGEGCAAHTRKY